MLKVKQPIKNHIKNTSVIINKPYQHRRNYFDRERFFWYYKLRRLWLKRKRHPTAKRSINRLKRNRYLFRLKYFFRSFKYSGFKNKRKFYFKKKLILKKFFCDFYGKIPSRYFLNRIKNNLYSRWPAWFVMLQFETQLNKFLCRTAFVPSLCTAKQLIKRGFVTINNQTIRNHRHRLKIGDTVTLNPIIIFNWKLLNWARIRRHYFFKYIESDYDIGLSTLVRYPVFKDLRKSHLIKHTFFKLLVQYYR